MFLKMEPYGDQQKIITYAGPKRVLKEFKYHVVLLIADDKGNWGFLDPILFHDTQTHSFQEWFEKFPNKFRNDLIYYVRKLNLN